MASQRAIFQVTKVNAKGKRQSRIIELNLESSTMINRDLNDEILKSFPIRTVLEARKEEKDPLTVLVRFSDVRQKSYTLIFSTPGEVSLFLDKISGALEHERSAGVGHLKTVFNVIKVNIRGIDVAKHCLYNFEPGATKPNKTFAVADIKTLKQSPSEPARLGIDFKKYGHPYTLYFETAAEKMAFVEKIQETLEDLAKSGRSGSSEPPPAAAGATAAGADAEPHEKERAAELAAGPGEGAELAAETVSPVPAPESAAAVVVAEGETQKKKVEGGLESTESPAPAALKRTSIFQVVKVNKRGKRQDRIVMVEPSARAFRNMDLNDNLKKAFKFDELRSYDAKGELEVDIAFKSKKQTPYALVFTSRGERDMFCSILEASMGSK